MAISEKLVKINEEVIIQEDLLAQIVTALEGKAGSGGSIPVIFETWVFTLEDGSIIEKQVEVGA